MRKEKKMITIINFDWLSFFESMNLRGRNIILNEEQYCKIVLIIFTLNYHDQNDQNVRNYSDYEFALFKLFKL